jgi:octaprenyl-diphosphate synthase
MTIQSIRALVTKELSDVNQLIHQEITRQHPFVAQLTENLFNGGGKQLRPLILLLTSKALGYNGHQDITLAAVLEFFHTASLLHDDVIDESKLRRGKKTAHEIWGNQASVLVGDYLFILHHQLLLSLKNMDMLELMAEIERQMGHGELVQLVNRHQTFINTKDYFSIIEAKTSLLFAAAAKLPGLLSQTSPENCEKLFLYGRHLGNAFQLIDDALDYCAESSTIGKNIGDDLADGKSTLPIIHALSQADEKNKTIIVESLQNGSLEHLDKIIQIVHDTQSIEYTKNIAYQEAQLAKQALDFLPESVYKTALQEIADYSIQREY